MKNTKNQTIDNSQEKSSIEYTKKRRKKKMEIIFVALLCLVLIVASVVVYWYYGKSYKQFDTISTKEFAIAGLKEGFTPQGIFYDQTSEQFLSCGYMKNGSASRIYVHTNGTTKYFTLTLDGVAYTGHCGGVATYGNFGYVVGDKKIYVFDLQSALACKNGETTAIIKVLDAPNGADFVEVSDGTIYIGEFYREQNYPTPDSHKLTVTGGVINPALTFAYTLDDEQEFGFDISSPAYAISTTGLVQGMCFTQNGIILSTSYSLADSKLYVHKPLASLTASQTFDYDGTDIDVYVLDSSNLRYTITAPCMTEEIAYYNGRIYVMFESACKKYSWITRTRTKNVYSFTISAYKGK
jgi:hypothetical protein